MANSLFTCNYCDQSDQVSPLQHFQNRGEQYWICSQHPPILNHNLVQLVDKLPGFDLVRPFEARR